MWDVAQSVEHRTGMLPTQVQFPFAARDLSVFLPIIFFTLTDGFFFHPWGFSMKHSVFVCIRQTFHISTAIFFFMWIYLPDTHSLLCCWILCLYERKPSIISGINLYASVICLPGIHPKRSNRMCQYWRDPTPFNSDTWHRQLLLLALLQNL